MRLIKYVTKDAFENLYFTKNTNRADTLLKITSIVMVAAY